MRCGLCTPVRRARSELSGGRGHARCPARCPARASAPLSPGFRAAHRPPACRAASTPHAAAVAAAAARALSREPCALRAHRCASACRRPVRQVLSSRLPAAGGAGVRRAARRTSVRRHDWRRGPRHASRRGGLLDEPRHEPVRFQLQRSPAVCSRRRTSPCLVALAELLSCAAPRRSGFPRRLSSARWAVRRVGANARRLFAGLRLCAPLLSVLAPSH